jgi:acyl-CoA thioesterase-1
LLAAGRTPAAASPGAHELVVVGDSLSAEYGLARGTGWAWLLRERMATEKPGWTVLNASISGDTTAGGLARLPALLKAHPSVVVIELGGNDALRGSPIAEVRRNLDAMATLVEAAGAKVLIAGIQVPPNYGRQYNADFAQMYVEVAAARHAALVPFLLKGVADRPDAQDWFQADGIHPIAKAHPIILDTVWPVLKPLLKP